MNWDEGLAGSALDIAKTDEKRLRVIAGPGTGKSFALKRRVTRLLEQGRDPDRILVVTFTRNAADSLVQDLADLSVVGCENVHVKTLHSYCLSLLSRAGVFEHRNRVHRPIVTFSTSGSLQFEGGMMLSDLVGMKKFGDKRDCTEHVKKFEASWATLQSERPGWPTDPTDEMFEEHLIRWLRFHRAMLIGELVPETLRFLRDNPASDALTAFDHVMVDEYQDLNRAEQEIIDLLSDKGSCVIVGDVDQSVYGFRHANPEGIEDFQNRHPTTHDESLTECRRCPTRIVTIADRLIKNNHPSNSLSRLQAMPNSENGKIHIIQWTGSTKEAQGIAEYIEHLLNDQGYVLGDILILTPRKMLAHKILCTIRKKKIPIYSFYGDEVLEKDSAQCALALLTLLDDKEDRVALRWWLGHGSPLGLRGPYQKLREYCEETDTSPRDALEAMDNGSLQIPDALPLLKPFRELIKNTMRLSSLNLRDLIDSLLPEDDGACAALRDIAEQAFVDSEDIHQLFNRIKDIIVHPEVPDGDFVKIMSPHKAKGLSSKVVIVTGCIEKLFPFVDKSLSPRKQEDAVREQRRLFYVAITRCREVLVLSSFTTTSRAYASRMRIPVYGDNVYARLSTSQFIHELGPTAPRARSGSEWQASGYNEAIDP